MNSVADGVWLNSALRSLFGPACRVAWCGGLPEEEGEMPAVEAVAVAGAAKTRKAEFVAGRKAARRALEELGYAQAVVPVGADRAPIWPEGAVGSIAHAEELAVAVAANAKEVGAVGIDVERSGGVGNDLWPMILTPAEQADLDRLPEDKRPIRATLIFSVKEAFYKFQYPLSRSWLDFDDVEVRFPKGDGACAVVPSRLLGDGILAASAFGVRYRIGPRYTLAGISAAPS